MSERYQIKERIGQGGLGEVFIATDTQLQREVALKRMKPVEGTSPDDLMREAKVLSALQHPNILTVFDVGRDGSGAFVITELLRGETLEQVISRGALTYEDFRQVAIQSLEGLIAAQAMGLVHRDLKPGNLMVIWHASGKFQLKILDFGLAKISQQASKQTEDQEEGILGSIYFMAPEQFERLPLDGRTDLYALGCIYYFALTGKHPFDGETAPAVMASHLHHRVEPLGIWRPDLPPWLCDWVMWFLNREAADRPATAKQALDAFQQQAEAWDTAVQAAPMAAAVAALTAASASSPPGTHRVGRYAAGPPSNYGMSTARIPTADLAAWETSEDREPPRSGGAPKWLLFLIPTILTLALGVGFWHWQSQRPAHPDSQDTPNGLPDSILSPTTQVPSSQPSPPTATPPAPKREPPPLPPPVAVEPPRKPTPKFQTGRLRMQPEAIPVYEDDIPLPVDYAIINGPSARPRTSVRAVGHWENADTSIVWDLDVAKAGTFIVSIWQSTDTPNGGGTYRISSGGRHLPAQVRPTANKEDLEWVEVGKLEISSGRQELTITPIEIQDSKNGLMNLAGARLRRL